MTRIHLPPLPQSRNYVSASTPLSLHRKQRRGNRGITATNNNRRRRRVAPSSPADEQPLNQRPDNRTTAVRFNLEANQTFADYCPALEHPDVCLKSDLYYSTDDVQYFRHQVKLIKQEFAARLKKNDVEKDLLIQHYRRMIQAFASSSQRSNKNITTAGTPRINHDDDASATSSSSSSSATVADKPAALSLSLLHDDEEEVSTATTGDHPQNSSGAPSENHDDDEASLFLLELMVGLPGGSWIVGPGAWRRDTNACREALRDVLEHFYDDSADIVVDDGNSSSSSNPAMAVVGDSEDEALAHECHCLTARHVLLAHGLATFYESVLS